MKPLFKLIRPINLGIIALTMAIVLFKYSGEAGENYWLESGILILAAILNAAAGYVVNDIFDIETDKINKPQKRIIEVSMSKKQAWAFYAVFASGSAALSLLFSKQFFIINVSLIALLYLYSLSLKGIPLIGNLVVAMCSAAVVACCILQVTFNTRSALWNFMGYVVFAFLISLIREIIKDIEDMEGDKAAGYKTYPVLLGEKSGKVLAFSLLGIEIVLCGVYSYIVAKIGWYTSSAVMGIITLGLFYVINILSKAKQKEEFKTSGNILKVLMLLGVINLIFS